MPPPRSLPEDESFGGVLEGVTATLSDAPPTLAITLEGTLSAVGGASRTAAREASTGAVRDAARADAAAKRVRGPPRAPESAAARAAGGTLEYKYQLAGHVARIEAATYNTRRHHILTADRATLRLWSLRKELRRLPAPQRTGLGAALHAVLQYCEAEDVYVAAFGGDAAFSDDYTPPEPDEQGKVRVDARALTDAGLVKVYHASLAVLLSFEAHRAPILDAVWIEPAQLFATSSAGSSSPEGGEEGAISVWHLRRQGRSNLATEAAQEAEAEEEAAAAGPESSTDGVFRVRGLQMELVGTLRDHCVA